MEQEKKILLQMENNLINSQFKKGYPNGETFYRQQKQH